MLLWHCQYLTMPPRKAVFSFMDFDFNMDFSFKGFDFDIENPVQTPEEIDQSLEARRQRAIKRLEVRGRGLDNLFTLNPTGVNEFDIPTTYPFTDDSISEVKWVDFNNKQKILSPENTATHFYIEDYQFTSIWNKPERYLPLFRKLKAVVTPDFSNYTDMPKPMDMWNCYRRQWCGAFWQDNGINVISSLSWAVGKIYDWTFAGIPEGTTCATSFVCNRMDKEQVIDELLMVVEKIKPHKLFIKCNTKDEDYLRKYFDFTVIQPYNWRRYHGKRE